MAAAPASAAAEVARRQRLAGAALGPEDRDDLPARAVAADAAAGAPGERLRPGRGTCPAPGRRWSSMQDDVVGPRGEPVATKPFGVPGQATTTGGRGARGGRAWTRSRPGLRRRRRRRRAATSAAPPSTPATPVVRSTTLRRGCPASPRTPRRRGGRSAPVDGDQARGAREPSTSTPCRAGEREVQTVEPTIGRPSSSRRRAGAARTTPCRCRRRRPSAPPASSVTRTITGLACWAAGRRRVGGAFSTSTSWHDRAQHGRRSGRSGSRC